MSRRALTIVAFVVAIILTILGAYYCSQKVLPLIRLALWFPLPYSLHAKEMLGVLLALIQFPLLALVFALAIRRWRASRVLASLVVAYGLYAAIIIAMVGPPP